jgi:acetyl-CoA carboxylase biotin carboxyl carrier protein
MSTPKRISVPAAKGASANIGLEDMKALISLVAKEQIHEFEYESGSVRFRIRKDAVVLAPAVPQTVVMAPAPSPLPQIHTQSLAAAVSEAPGISVDEPGIHYITSPIVGTFYRAPGPSASPYVQVGDFVKPGQTLCVVEAMKLMNEIECDTAGEVLKVLVENGQPVEYGERLFAIRMG